MTINVTLSVELKCGDDSITLTHPREILMPPFVTSIELAPNLWGMVKGLLFYLNNEVEVQMHTKYLDENALEHVINTLVDHGWVTDEHSD